MTRSTILAFALLGWLAAPALAQDKLLGKCKAQQGPANLPEDARGQFQFLCAQVVNTITGAQPAVGIAFSGGNPVLGTGTTLGTRLGSIPRISVTARANLAAAQAPKLFQNFAALITDNQGALKAMETTGLPVGSLQADVSIGVFNGFSLAPMVGGVGAVDVLGSVAFIPKIERVGIQETIRNIGGGLRVGVLKQGLLAPGVSVTGMYRRMSDVSFGPDTLDAGHPGNFRSDLQTVSLRAVASKGILMLDFAVGAGYDRYSSDVAFGWFLECGKNDCKKANNGKSIAATGQVSGELQTNAWNVFGDVALNLLLLNVVAEVGYQKATELLDVDDLRKHNLKQQQLTREDLSGGRLFGSFGLRLAL
ncbi:MAG: hypothetical protein HY703_09860 [Gemmatimonadetes bacterium]|nr:hypothetical protein [Gemmatimonadota bacterium]